MSRHPFDPRISATASCCSFPCSRISKPSMSMIGMQSRARRRIASSPSGPDAKARLGSCNASRAISLSPTYGGLETITRNDRSATGTAQSPSIQVTFGRSSRRVFCTATANASILASTAVMSQQGRSPAIATAIAPLPVPRSRIYQLAARGISRSARSTSSSVSGRGTRVAGVTSNSSDQNSLKPVM